jgi:hypothetical protein
MDQRYVVHRGRGKRAVRKGSIGGDFVSEIVAHARSVNRILAAVASGDRDELSGLIEDREHLVASMNLRLASPLESADPPRMVLVPRDLLSAIFYILAERLANKAAFKRCPWCNDFFEVGNGTGHTLATKFCSVDHRRKMAMKLRDLRAKGERV